MVKSIDGLTRLSSSTNMYLEQYAANEIKAQIEASDTEARLESLATEAANDVEHAEHEYLAARQRMQQRYNEYQLALNRRNKILYELDKIQKID